VGRREFALPVALILIAAIGAADYLTGYEVRLAILYFLPVSLATWCRGRTWGLAMAALCPITWAASFVSQHGYSNAVYFYWDGVVMAVTLLLFVDLLSRLRHALDRSDERFLRVLDGLHAAVYVADDDDRVLYANRRLQKLIGDGTRAPTVADIASRFARSRQDSVAPSADASDGGFTGGWTSYSPDARRARSRPSFSSARRRSSFIAAASTRSSASHRLPSCSICASPRIDGGSAIAGRPMQN
jgi:PAS domain-containing protein